MFTGIVEEKGAVRRVVSGGEWGSLEIKAGKVLSGTKIGDSIAVNGVCLTVTGLGADRFSADVMAETMRRTNLGLLKSGESVNLERAMAADGRFGGHIVSGHIDGTGRVRDLRREGNAVWVTVEAPPSILELIIEKGSVAIDGISLTVAAVEADAFRVSIIPHTGEETTLLAGRPGKIVNLENDIVGKYVKKLVNGPAGREAAGREEQSGAAAPGGGLTLEFLQQNGF